MKITMYELIGLIKDNKAPRVIKYEDIEFIWTDGNYIGGGTYLTNYVCDLDDREIANLEFEILPEENDEWEDIEEINNDYYDEANDYVSKGGKEISNGELVDKINRLIKNQRKIIEILKKDE